MKEFETLRSAVDSTAAMARTRRLDVSFNELMDMYLSDQKELEITPAFQRVLVWNYTQRSQFIESLLLELPIPPIYVIEHGREGHYILIDGLQRLSSYLHFRGVLDNEFKEIRKGDFLQLEGCDIVKELNGATWVDLDTALQIRLKRSFVSLQVIRQESLPDLKYHMFKRLNAGGVQISAQQIRNAYVRMLPFGDKIMDFAHNLASNEAFKGTCTNSLTDKQVDQQDDEGFILRFLAMKNNRAAFKHDVEPFIDDFIERVARGSGHPEGLFFDYEKEQAIFEKTFAILAASTAEYSFTYPNKKKGELTRGFSATHFEGAALGIQKHLESLNENDSTQMQALHDALKRARLSPEFIAVSSGGGRNSSGLLNSRVSTIESAVAGILS